MAEEEEKEELSVLELESNEVSYKNNKEKFVTFHFTKRFKLRVHKPLLSIKVGYFLWMTASSSVLLYFYVYLKLQGLTITNLFWINTITSITTVTEIPLFAVIVDKLGLSSKSALVSNILLSCAILFSISQIPPLPFCEARGLYDCLNDSITFTQTEATCDAATELRTSLCEVQCLTMSLDDDMCRDETRCETIHDFFKNSSLTNVYCYNFETVQSFANLSKSLCGGMQNDSCSVSCPMVDSAGCEHRKILLLAAYSVLTCFYMVSYANVFRFLDVTAVALLKEHSFDYGVLRFWGTFGALLGPALTGFVVQSTTPDGEPANYKSSFYLQIVLILLTAAVSYQIDVRPLDPGDALRKKIATLIRIPDVLIFMFILLTLGTTWAFNTLFKSWYLNDIGASAQALSAVNTLMALYGLPFLYNSDWILKKLGNTKTIVLALVGHAVHSFGYSVIENAWYGVILEVTAIVTYHLLWISATHVTRKITPEGLLATVNSSAGNLHFNFGRITGSFFGGFLMKTYGGRFTYKIMGIINTVISLLYVTYLYIYAGKEPIQHDSSIPCM